MTRFWVIKRQSNRAQIQSASCVAAHRTLVNWIADDAVAEGVEVAADLVGSTCVEGHFEQRRVATHGPSARCQPPEAGVARFAVQREVN